MVSGPEKCLNSRPRRTIQDAMTLDIFGAEMEDNDPHFKEGKKKKNPCGTVR